MKESSNYLPGGGDTGLDKVSGVAADWLARREGGLTADEQEQFDHWILADARHAAAVEQIELAWTLMQKPRFTGQSEDVIRAVEQRVRARVRARRRRTWQLSMVGLAAAAAVVVAFISFGDRKRNSPAELAANIEIKAERQLLADGSVVELNAGSEIAVEYTPQLRRVRLVRGEAHFAVARNVARPFIVTAGSVAVRALGTEFVVRFDPAAVDVVVTEGRVSVQRVDLQPAIVATTIEPAAVELPAGAKIVVPLAASVSVPLQVQPMAAADIQSALAWRTMRVEFTETPLSDVLASFNRHNDVQLALGEGSLEGIRIGGVFWLDDPEGFSRLIEASAGLQATREAHNRIVLKRP